VGIFTVCVLWLPLPPLRIVILLRSHHHLVLITIPWIPPTIRAWFSQYETLPFLECQATTSCIKSFLRSLLSQTEIPHTSCCTWVERRRTHPNCLWSRSHDREVFSYHHCTLDGAISRPVALLFFDCLVLASGLVFYCSHFHGSREKDDPILSMEKAKCIWNVGLGEEDSRYTTKRPVFLLLSWMDGCFLGMDIPMCCVLLLLRPSSHPVQNKRLSKKSALVS